MSSLALAVSVLSLALGAVLFARWLYLSRKEISQSAVENLQRKGQATFNLHKVQKQHAVVFASSHYLLTAACFLVTLTLTGSLVPAILVAIVTHAVPRRWMSWQRTRRLRRIEADLPDALMFIVGALQAGSALHVALQVLVKDRTGPLSQELGFVLREQRLGVPFDEALQRMALRVPVPDLHLVIVALRVSKEVGGNLSEPLRVLSETIRRKAMLEGRVKALTAQGKIQGVVMTGLPVLLLAVIYPMQPSMKMLFTTNFGWMVLGVCTVMLIIGYKVIQKLVTIDI